MKTLLLTTAMLFAAPAFAQTAATPSTNAAQLPTPAAPATAAKPAQTAPQPAADAPVATQATPDTTQQGTSGSSVTTTPAPAATTNPADAVSQVVNNDWSKYDADTNSNLSKAEFAKWMIALRDQNPAAQKQQVTDTTAWANAAFAQADKDKNGSVSKEELESFLKG